MARTNHERVGKTFELLQAGLSPVVEREFRNRYQAKPHGDNEVVGGRKGEKGSWKRGRESFRLWRGRHPPHVTGHRRQRTLRDGAPALAHEAVAGRAASISLSPLPPHWRFRNPRMSLPPPAGLSGLRR